jgi:hypothetical protein
MIRERASMFLYTFVVCLVFLLNLSFCVKFVLKNSKIYIRGFVVWTESLISVPKSYKFLSGTNAAQFHEEKDSQLFTFSHCSESNQWVFLATGCLNFTLPSRILGHLLAT